MSKRLVLLCVILTFGVSDVTEAQWWKWWKLKKVTVVVDPGFTHFVSQTGSAVSNCTMGSPCTFPRAITLLNNGTIGAGSVVSLDSTTPYDFDAPVITGDGTAGNPVKFIGSPGQAIFAPLRTSVPTGGWSLVAGRTYAYEMTWDEVANYSVATMVSYNPTSGGWTNVLIRDPGVSGTDTKRQFVLDFPPRLKQITPCTTAAVDAQYGTWCKDETANKLYVHTYTDTAPAAAHNLYIANSSRSALVLSGADYLWFEKITLMYAESDGGFTADNTSDNGTLKNAVFRDSSFGFLGDNWLVEDLDAGYGTAQGVFDGGGIPGGCYPTDPVFVGACWNDSGTGGFGGFGSQANGLNSVGNTLRRFTMHHGWGGFSIYGSDVLVEDGSLSKILNHAFNTGECNNVTVRRIIVTGVPESWFNNQTDTNCDNVTAEHNIFPDVVLAWGMANTGWILRNNIFSILAVDAPTAATLTLDCNLYIHYDDHDIQPAQIVTIGATTYNTLAALQAGTTFEDNGAELAKEKWYDATQFLNFTAHFATFDFHPVVGAQAIAMPGACGYAGPYATP